MRPSLHTALLLAASSGIHTTRAWVVLPVPPPSTTGTTVLRSSLYAGGDAPSDPSFQQRVEESPPLIQPIQPGFSEPPLYVDPPASMSLAPPTNTNGNDASSRSLVTPNDNDRNYGFRTYNDQAANMIQSSNNQLDQQPKKRPMLPGLDAERIQGNSLRTYSSSPYDNNGSSSTSTTVELTSQGRPIHADLQMWSGPNNTPQSVKLYSQDGSEYGVSATFNNANYQTQQTKSVSIRNEGNMEFPVTARVSAQGGTGPSAMGQSQQDQSAALQTQSQPPPPRRALEFEGGVLIQGEGMVKTFPIAANVQKVQILLQSSATSTGRRLPIMGKVELLQGPNNVKTTADIYDDGLHGEYFETVFDTPGYSCSLRITNTGPMTYPFHVLVMPHSFGDPKPMKNDFNDITASRFGPDGQFRG